MIISVENGCFTYKGAQRPQLKNMSFAAHSGDLVAILGPNGAGKTTFLRCITGLLDWDSGESRINDESIAQMSARQLWQTIAYVPQARSAIGVGSVRECVLLGRASRIGMLQKPRENDYAKTDEILRQLSLDGIADKQCSRISGGELQLTLIARALAAEPKILILDEPESNLDFKNQLLVLQCMSKLAKDGMICIFNTHYPAHALQRANKALLLRSDGSYSFGDTKSIITEQSIEQAFSVRAALGEIETPQRMMSSIVPLEIINSSAPFVGKESGDKKIEITATDSNKIAVIAIITDDGGQSDKINAILHRYNDYLVGRMGMPYRKAGLYIINVTIDAPQSSINAIMSELNLLNASVKVTYA